MLLYRGTQRPEISGVRKGLSYTPSLAAAIIWSSVPPDVWSRREAVFLPTSTVHRARLKRSAKVLSLAEDNYVSFDHVLAILGYGERDGIDHAEALKILQYMHNRITGRARGGEFLYRVVDEDGEELNERDLPFSLSNPMTLIGEFKDEFGGDDSIAARLRADTFIFADAPATQRAALKLGYDALHYRDLFAGAESVSEKLLGIRADDLEGVETDYDLQGEDVYVHETYRPLKAGAIEVVDSVLTKDLLRQVDLAELSRSK